ncbi:MAG: hypothetical protein ACQEXJ_06845 [Myxococcota bacterium]
MSDRATEAARVVARILGLESARLLAMAAVLRSARPDPGQLRDVDRAIESALETLVELGVAYPGHVLGRRYDLSGPEYAVLQLALMPHHTPDDFTSLVWLLDDREEVPRLRHALRLLAPPREQEALRSLLEAGPLVGEGLVRLTGEDDPALIVNRSVLELYGLE